MYFFEEDDNALQELYQGYKSGKILAGEMKQICIDRASEWLKELKEKKEEAPSGVHTSSSLSGGYRTGPRGCGPVRG